MIPPEVLELASERGTIVHRACAAHALNLYGPIITPDHFGYYKSFTDWFGDYVAEVYFAESELVDSELGIIGHPDIGIRLTDGRRLIVDLKTPAVEAPTWKAQTAGYVHLANRRYGPCFFEGGMALRLKKDGGKAKATVYKNTPADFALFLSALNCWRGFKA